MTGTPCTACRAGHLVCYCTRRSTDGSRVTRYFACYLCGQHPEDNKTIAAAAPKRQKRSY